MISTNQLKMQMKLSHISAASLFVAEWGTRAESGERGGNFQIRPGTLSLDSFLTNLGSGSNGFNLIQQIQVSFPFRVLVFVTFSIPHDDYDAQATK